jgi:hypothetical protein
MPPIEKNMIFAGLYSALSSLQRIGENWGDEIHLKLDAHRLNFLHHFCSENQVSGFGFQER